MSIDEIIKELSVFGNDRPLPREALAEAARQKGAITPVLLNALDTTYKKVQIEGGAVCDDPSYDLSYYAIFLLAQFREQKAFPLLLQILALDQDSLDILLGDSFSDFMPSVLYSTYNGDFSALRSIIENDSLDPFARGAALETLGGLLRDKLLSRQELIGFLRERLAALGESEDENIFGAMIVSLIADNDLYDMTEDVREAFRQKKIEVTYLGDFDEFFDYLYNETKDHRYVHLLEDAVQELSGWACFQTEGPHKPSAFEILDWKAGRNDPCPCGSGKKFKKCCLPKQEELKMELSDMNVNKNHGFNKYPPIGRQNGHPGLSDFYSQDAIKVDQLVYQAFSLCQHPGYQQRKEMRSALKESRELLWAAFEEFRQICETKGLKTPEEFDREHKLHYLSRNWLNVLKEHLDEVQDERYQAVQAVLQLPSI